MLLNPIIFGATGMVGEGVLHVALNDPSVGSALAINRRPCGVKHAKLKEIIHADFYDFSPLEEQLTGYSACFFCLGVSSVGMKEEAYRRITYDLTMAAARTLARINPDMAFCYVSGKSTDSTEQGRLMWARVKGKTENDLAKLPFKNVYLFRPGFIRPIKGLHNAYAIYKYVDWLYPTLRRFFPNGVCTLDEIGRAMLRCAGQGYPKQILECEDIQVTGG